MWVEQQPILLYQSCDPLLGPAAVRLGVLEEKCEDSPAEGAPVVATPDGRYFAWASPAGDVLFIVTAWADYELFGYSAYRLQAAFAMPGFDATGEWIFAPLPELDEVIVLQ